jgi:hypothetical protein
VYVRRGWLYAYVGYCNSPLNNKNIDYHCPVVFSCIGFPHKSLSQLCDCCSQFIACLCSICALFFFRRLTSGIRSGGASAAGEPR